MWLFYISYWSVCCATLHCFPATPDELQTPGGGGAGVRGAGEPRPRGLPAVGRRWLGSSRVRQAVLRRVRPQRRIRQLWIWRPIRQPRIQQRLQILVMSPVRATGCKGLFGSTQTLRVYHFHALVNMTRINDRFTKMWHSQREALCKIYGKYIYPCIHMYLLQTLAKYSCT